MDQLNDKQIEAATLLRSIDASEDIIDQIMNMIKDQQSESNNQPIFKESEDLIIREKIEKETDWRKIAALNAKLISNGLDY